MNLSPHFTLEEAIFSSTALRVGIDNSPTKEQIAGAKIAAAGMEIVRHILGDVPIHVDSWIRCTVLNSFIGGSSTSAHMRGYAVDFLCPLFGTPIEIVKMLSESELLYDQLIQEGSWVHISFAPTLRQELLTAHFDNRGRASYTNGIQAS